MNNHFVEVIDFTMVLIPFSEITRTEQCYCNWYFKNAGGPSATGVAGNKK